MLSTDNDFVFVSDNKFMMDQFVVRGIAKAFNMKDTRQ